MTSVNIFLRYIYENYVAIMVSIGLVIGIIRRTMALMNNSHEEKIAIAKSQIKQVMLKMVEEAETGFEDYNYAGAIKRSNVIAKIFHDYPILSKVVDQEEIINWIDIQIDNSLSELENIINKNITNE